MAADETKPEAKKTEAPKAPPMSDAEHHAALTARVDVTAVKPKRVVKGRVFPEERENVKMVSLRCAVAHRVLHGMSPKELDALKKASGKDGDAFEHFALRHIESKLEGVPAGELATQELLLLFGSPDKVAKFRKAAIDALAKS